MGRRVRGDDATWRAFAPTESLRIQLSNSNVIYKHSFAISRPDTPEFYPEVHPLMIRGRRECRAPAAPAASHAK